MGLPLCSKSRISPGGQWLPGPPFSAPRPPSSPSFTSSLSAPLCSGRTCLLGTPHTPAHACGNHLSQASGLSGPFTFTALRCKRHTTAAETAPLATYTIQPPRLLDCSPHRCRLWRLYFCMCLLSISLTRMSGPRRLDPPAYFTAASQHLTQREHSAQTHPVNESLPPPPCTNPITHLHTCSHTGKHIQLSDLAR